MLSWGYFEKAVAKISRKTYLLETASNKVARLPQINFYQTKNSPTNTILEVLEKDGTHQSFVKLKKTFPKLSLFLWRYRPSVAVPTSAKTGFPEMVTVIVVI